MPARFPAVIDETTFAFAVGRLRVLETKLIDTQRFDRMVEAASAAEVYRILSETDYAESLALSEDVFDFETMLVAETKRFYDYVASFVPQDAVLDALRIRYDFHNLKVLLKQRLLGEAVHEDALFSIGTVAADLLSAGLELHFFGLPTGLDPVFIEAIEGAVSAYRASGDPQKIGMSLDRSLFLCGTRIAKQSKNEMLIGIWQAWVDLANFKSFARAARASQPAEFLRSTLLPGGLVSTEEMLALYLPELASAESLVTFAARTRYQNVVGRGMRQFFESGNLTLYEKLADNFVLGLLLPARRISLGFEPVIMYVLLRENEIKNLRIVLTGKINGLPSESIRERLRDVYV